MKLTGLAISMGVGLAAGAITAAMLPRNCTAKKAIQKAAVSGSNSSLAIKRASAYIQMMNINTNRMGAAITKGL